MNDSNRRRYPRHPTDDLPGRLGFSLDADVRNISLAGMAVHTTNPFAMDQKYTVRLGADDDSVEVVAAVRWCHFIGTRDDEKGESVPLYEAGFEFEGVLSDRAQSLLHFLEEHVVLDLEERLFGRIVPKENAPVNLSSEYRFQVKTLSYGGMAIEIGFSIPMDSVFPMTIQLGDAEFETPGRIANVVKPDVEGQKVRYLMGVEFVETDPEEREKLTAFIRERLAEDHFSGPPD